MNSVPYMDDLGWHIVLDDGTVEPCPTEYTLPEEGSTEASIDMSSPAQVDSPTEVVIQGSTPTEVVIND